MKERPILFSGPMVNAILEGRKTQTRRALKTQPLDVLPMNEPGKWISLISRDPKPQGMLFGCRFGLIGDRLRVKETFYAFGKYRFTGERTAKGKLEVEFWDCTEDANGEYRYAADVTLPKPASRFEMGWHKRPSIFMPLKASRITLEITNVRVERLQDISEADVLNEGLAKLSKDGKTWKFGKPDRDGLPGNDNDGWPWQEWSASHTEAFGKAWNKINGKGAFELNPWVWVVGFQKVG